MKGRNILSWKPYRPIDEPCGAGRLYICRLAPGENGVEGQFAGFSSGERCEAVVTGESGEIFVSASGGFFKVDGLAPDAGYRIKIRSGGICGRERLFRTGAVPDTVVNYLHPEDEVYAFSGRSLCSPSIAKTDSGRLLCSMDVYSSRAPQNLSLLFASDDGGESWRWLCDLFPCFWGKLFCRGGAAYMLSTTTEYGFLQIARSDDGGESWSAPVNLFPGAGQYTDKGMHRAPMPVISHAGRLWTDVDYGCWSGGGHSNALLSADENADLMKPESWTLSGFWRGNAELPGGIPEGARGCIEGNAVVSPSGELCDFLRYASGNYPPDYGRAVILSGDASDPEKAPVLDRVIPFNGASGKFPLLRDPETGFYIAISNLTVDGETPGQRNLLAFRVSEDMYRWRTAEMIYDRRGDDPKKTGFQYVDMIIDGEDVLFVCRTAINMARNFHDANYTLFGRIGNFRRYFRGQK